MSSITLRELFIIDLERNTKSRDETAKSVVAMRYYLLVWESDLQYLLENTDMNMLGILVVF